MVACKIARRGGHLRTSSVAATEMVSNRGLTMELSPAEQTLRDRAFKAMLEATFPLPTGLDHELILQALRRDEG